MRLIDKNSRRGIVNLLAEFILTKIDKTKKTIIQVSDCGPFMVVNGITESEDFLELTKITESFIEEFGDVTEKLDIKTINVIDVIRYGAEPDLFTDGWFEITKGVYNQSNELENEITITSEFPYGYSIDCGRLERYYSQYIFNHMFNLLGVDNVKFFYSNKLDETEDLEIDIISDSKIDKTSIKSLILDVFDFNLTIFRKDVENYNLIEDITNPNGEKPYLKQDKLEHIILF